MNEITKRKINPNKAITEALPSIIEAFVTFYGEEERANIEKKFRDLVIVGYCKPETLETIVNKDCNDKSTELIEEFLNNVKIGIYNKEQLKEIIFSDIELNHPNLHNINKYIAYKNGDTYYKEAAVEFLSKFYSHVNIDNIDDLITNNELVEMDNLVKQYNERLEKYKEYKESFKSCNEYISKCRELKERLEKKYVREYLEEIKNYFTESELLILQNILNKNGDFWDLRNSKVSKINNVLNFSLNYDSCIEAFSRENEEILNDEKVNTWRKDSIKSDRVKYFINLGIDLGSDYNSYISNPLVQKLIPSVELVESITKKRENAYDKMMNEFYSSIEDYTRNRQRIDRENLLDKDDSYNAETYENNQTFVAPNFKNNGKECSLYPMLCISMGMPDEFLDHYLIHELNHVYEINLIGFNNGDYSCICGWDLLHGKISNQLSSNVPLKVDREKRDYELFNEIINELIAQEISEIMYSSNICIFNTKENTKFKGSTDYEHTFFLVRDFYQKYKQDIIASRKNGDLTVLFDKIGQENFEELNKLFHVFNDNFAGFKFYGLCDDLQNKRETERTKIYHELVLKRDEILAKIQEYSESKNINM